MPAWFDADHVFAFVMVSIVLVIGWLALAGK